MRLFLIFFGGFQIFFNALDLNAQRGHELKFQVGYFQNAGTAFMDYFETADIRHNFEFDQKYSATLYSLGWNYPINGHLEIGVFLTSTWEASVVLLEQESAVFNLEGRALRPDTLYSGMTKFDSDFSEAGVAIKLNLIRFNKFKWYMNSTFSFNYLDNTNDEERVIQATNPELRDAIIRRYTKKERWSEIGIGFGLSYALKHGITITVLEVHAKKPLVTPIGFSDTFSNVECRSGLAYQFYRRK